jgi:hypothetical protein
MPTDRTTTASMLAEYLRRAAAALDKAEADLQGFDGLQLYLTIDADTLFGRNDEAGRVAAVHTLARHFGVTGDRKQSYGAWTYEARQATGPASTRLYTDIDAPPKRCACGQTCTHTTGTTRAA